MSETEYAFQCHAQIVLDHELRRARGALAALPDDRRLAVEESTVRVTTALVDGMVEHARGEPSLAEALSFIYGAALIGKPKTSMTLRLDSQGGS
jgi:hypothetical protein